MALYNLRSADGQWKITKFDNDLNVESSYVTSLSECGCPAGSRPTCRHRQMLPKMLEVGAEDSGLFYDFDSDKFFEPLSDTDPELTDVTSLIAEPTFAEDVASAASGSSDTEPESELEIGATAGRSAELVEPAFKAGELVPDTKSWRDTNEIESDLSRTQLAATAHPSIGHIKRRI